MCMCSLVSSGHHVFDGVAIVEASLFPIKASCSVMIDTPDLTCMYNYTNMCTYYK